MAVRCSNGVGFIVLEPIPALRTGISIEIYEGSNPLNLIDVLPDSFGRKWTDPRKGPGAGEFKVYANNPKVLGNPTLLEPGNIVRMLLDRVPRFAFKIESRNLTQIGEGDDAAVAWHIKGRGALCLLEDAQIYPVGGLSGAAEREYTGATPGEVLGELIAEAQARPSSILSQITEGYTDTRDANNIPYARTMTINERAGTDLLRIAERITDLAADVYMTPTLELRIVNDRGIDRSVQTADVGPVVLRRGQNILELARGEDAVIRNALLIETPGGFVERIEASSVSTYRRREGFISLGNITDTTQIDRAAEAVFERSANPAESITIRVSDDEGRRPYVDWSIGDWVLAPDIEGVLDRFRVNALTITEADDGTIDAIPELATVTDDLEERLARWLKSMARGTMGGTASEVTEPNRAPAEVVDAIDSGIGDHEATFLHPDELSDLADVDVTGLADDDILRYDSGSGDWQPEALELDALEDVDLTTPPTDGQVLVFDDGDSQWRPGDQSAGGGGGGGRTLLVTEVIASSVASVEITGINQTYDELLIVLDDVTTADTAKHDAPHLQVGDDTAIDTGAVYLFDATRGGDSDADLDDDNATSFLTGTAMAVLLGSGETTGHSYVEWRIVGYARDDTHKAVQFWGAKGGDSQFTIRGNGMYYGSENPIERIRLSAADGNLISGTIYVYGISY